MKKFRVLCAKYPFYRCWEKEEQFDTFKKVMKYTKSMIKRDFCIIEIQCIEIKNKKLISKERMLGVDIKNNE